MGDACLLVRQEPEPTDAPPHVEKERFLSVREEKIKREQEGVSSARDSGFGEAPTRQQQDSQQRKKHVSKMLPPSSLV